MDKDFVENVKNIILHAALMVMHAALMAFMHPRYPVRTGQGIHFDCNIVNSKCSIQISYNFVNDISYGYVVDLAKSICR